MNTDNYAVIMAGGVGSRFWPLSKENLPKQFLDLLGTGETLIQKTYARLAKIIAEENIFILTNETYKALINEQLPKVSSRQIIYEPAMRNTAPCILLASMKIQKENSNASLIVAPSDHWIEDEKAFAQDVAIAFKSAKRDHSLMTLGIRPTFPNTGYGYIAFDKTQNTPVKRVKRFTEKPNYETAKTFLNQRNYLWNAGIFIAQTTTLLATFKEHLPNMHRLFYQGLDKLNTSNEAPFLTTSYPQAQNTSIDYGIMEKAQNVKVLPGSFDWNDLGSWSSLYDKLPKDKADNVVVNSQALLEDARDNIIRTPKGKVVVIKGLDDHIVVENDDILLIYPKSQEQEIKNTRKKVQDKFGVNLG